MFSSEHVRDPTTETKKEQEAEAKPEFVAVHETLFVPRGNLDPDGGTHVLLVIASVLVALAEYVTYALGTLTLGVTVMLAGHVMVGGAAFETEILKLQDEV
jgi:hypothetical protein